MRYIIFLFLSCFSIKGQTKFNYVWGYPTVYDSINKLTYGFDTAAPTFLSSESIVGKKSINYSIVKDINSKFKLRGKRKLDLNLLEIGDVKTNALNIGLINQCLNIDVFLGIELLENKKLHFNFKEQLFTNLYDLTIINLDKFTEIPINYNSYDSYYYISIMINEKKTKFLLDLGFSGEIQFKKDIIQTNNLTEITDVLYFGANGKKIKTIENYKNVKLSFPNNVHLFNSVSKIKDNKLNLIGIGFFKQFEEVIFDFEQKKIYISKSKLVQDNGYNTIGFEINNNEIFISSINHNSEYYKSGFRVGHVITFDDKLFEEKIIKNPCNSSQIIREHLKSNQKLPKIKKNENYL